MDTADIEVGIDLNEFIKENEIIIFSKSTCAFCFKLKRTLSAKGVSFRVLECDKEKGLDYYKPLLKQVSGIETFPSI